jgi:hypothetical protein
MAAEESLWEAVRRSPQDVQSWTLLLAAVERSAQPDIRRVRQVFDGFLAEFPLCYVYWKKHVLLRFGLLSEWFRAFQLMLAVVFLSVTAANLAKLE